MFNFIIILVHTFLLFNKKVYI